MHGFDCPVIRVVDDAAVFVGFDTLAFDDPFQRGFAVDDIVVGVEWNATHGDFGVVNDGAFVFACAKFHFGDVEVFSRQAVEVAVELDGVGFYAFIVEVVVGELTACITKMFEVGIGFDAGDTRQFFAEVVGVAAAVVFAV